MNGGEVILVGGGPGDPGLITVAGLRALETAEVVLYDRLAPLALLEGLSAELIEVGKIPRGAFTPQERIDELLISHARQGKRVVRLKGGDPFVFGRGSEEWMACADAGIAVRVIPGVTSAVAAPALAGIPVTHRGLSQGFTVISGHVPPGDPRSDLDWTALARTGTTLVVLMGVANLPVITAALIAGGLPAATPVTVICDAGHPNQRSISSDLDQVAERAAEAGIEPPAVTVIGAVAGLDLAASIASRL